eukprot:TRINITY_DN47238_c0_g1_i1.p1 TRINITY_DN47238_c0_g1~~TRINITY_DN47238_c0_g1_i1.p1  ORF type:complete len:584 (+),score=210.88 TRINITY_DN47238_c0_g1_i1:89-1753(+)
MASTPDASACARSQELRLRGNELYKDGKYKEAIQVYTESLQLNPRDHITLGNRSQARFKLSTIADLQECIRDSEEAIKCDPRFGKAYLRKANALLKLGQLERAKAVYADAAARFRPDIAVEKPTHEQSLFYAKLIGDFDGALAEARKLCADEQWEEAAKRLRPLAEAATHDEDVVSVFAEAAYHAGRFEDVITHVKGIITANPFKNIKELRWYHACAYWQMALLEDAQEQLDAFSLDIEAGYRDLDKKLGILSRVRLHIKNANTFSKDSKHAWARDELTKALEPSAAAAGMDPNPNMCRLLRTHRAIMHMHLHNYKDAIEDCNEALRGAARGPWRIRAYQCRGYCYEATDKHVQAIRDYEAAIAINPYNPQTKARLELLRRLKPRRKDYYAILGVDKDSSEAEIRRAYRKLALEYHPDKQVQKTKSEEERERGKELFQDIQEAYGILSDQSKRERYDRGETRESIDSPDSDPLVFFNIICGTLPEDANSCQTCLYEAKRCGFWTCACVVVTATCPCWCPFYCLQDRNVYKTQYEKYQQEYQEKYARQQAEQAGG